MSKKVDICDLCERRYPEYKFKFKARKWFYCGYMEQVKETYDICDNCWIRLRNLAQGKG